MTNTDPEDVELGLQVGRGWGWGQGQGQGEEQVQGVVALVLGGSVIGLVEYSKIVAGSNSEEGTGNWEAEYVVAEPLDGAEQEQAAGCACQERCHSSSIRWQESLSSPHWIVNCSKMMTLSAQVAV